MDIAPGLPHQDSSMQTVLCVCVCMNYIEIQKKAFYKLSIVLLIIIKYNANKFRFWNTYHFRIVLRRFHLSLKL